MATIVPDEEHLKLVSRFSLRPITGKKQYEAALEMAGELVGAQRLRKVESDYLDVLASLIVRYEEAEHPIPAVDEADTLRHLMGENGLSLRQLASEVGIAHTTLSAVLNRRRRLTREHIAALSERFRISPEAFFD